MRSRATLNLVEDNAPDGQAFGERLDAGWGILFKVRSTDEQIPALEEEVGLQHLANQIAHDLGILPHGEVRWHELSHARARRVLVSLIHKDLAYGEPRQGESGTELSADEAAMLADAYLGLFEPPRYLLTNGIFWDNQAVETQDPPEPSLSAWDPVTGATFDTGVMIISPRRVGMLWVEDED